MRAGARIDTRRLVLRHWQDDEIDRAAFHRLFSDPKVMRFFPDSFSHAENDDLLNRLFGLIAERGLGWCAVCLKDEKSPVGFSGLMPVRFDAAFTPAVEIGWRFLPEHWGNGYATEAAIALLAHGFTELALDRIVAFAVRSNAASIAVMRRIGMSADPTLDFCHPHVPLRRPDLQPHVFWRITRAEWAALNPS